MSKQISCPSCGSSTTVINPGITMVVCEYCKTSIYWDEDEVLRAGEKSILAEADTRLYFGATGSIEGKRYQVVGHVRYDHGKGAWDEWYLDVEGGKYAWLSEDERDLTLERPLESSEPIQAFHQLSLSAQLSLGGTTYTVREKGEATCIGGEGQLPFTVLPGEHYPYVDIASLDGEHFASIEYDEGQRPRCFSGQPLTHDQLRVDEERAPMQVEAGEAESQGIKCPNCGAALQKPVDRVVETLVCEYCGAQNDLTGAEARVMGINPKKTPAFKYDIGKAGRFDNARYEVCGRLYFEDDEGYPSFQYLLFNPDRGYLWLEYEDGEWALNQSTQKAPDKDPFTLQRNQKVKVGSTTYAFKEQGRSNLKYVDGALPWVASSGDRNRYADFAAGKKQYGVEHNGKEIEYFEGQTISKKAVKEAFAAGGRPVSGQPSSPSPSAVDKPWWKFW